jgi:hypothetical protein
MPLGDAVNLLLYGAGVGVDVKVMGVTAIFPRFS